jgi:hypothetical protein
MKNQQITRVYSFDGKIRISCIPEYDECKPWILYAAGSAVRHFAELIDAVKWAEERYKTKINTEPDKLMDDGSRVVYWPHHNKTKP